MHSFRSKYRPSVIMASWIVDLAMLAGLTQTDPVIDRHRIIDRPSADRLLRLVFFFLFFVDFKYVFSNSRRLCCWLTSVEINDVSDT